MSKAEATPGQADQHEQPAIIPIPDAEDHIQVDAMPLQQEQVPPIKEEHAPESMSPGGINRAEQIKTDFLSYSQEVNAFLNAGAVRKRAKKAMDKAIAEHKRAKKHHMEVRAFVMDMHCSSDEPMPDAADE